MLLFYQFGSEAKFLATVRLIGWRAELLLGVEIVGVFDITVGFEKREFHIGQGAWQVMAHYEKHRWVFPMTPTARGRAKLEEYFSKIKKYELEVSDVRVDFGDISEVMGFQLIDEIAVKFERALWGCDSPLRGMFPRYLAKTGNMYPKEVNVNNGGIMEDLGK